MWNLKYDTYIYTYYYTLLYIKLINNKDLLCITGNCIQYLIIIYKGKERIDTYVCITESLGCTPETNTIL